MVSEGKVGSLAIQTGSDDLIYASSSGCLTRGQARIDRMCRDQPVHRVAAAVIHCHPKHAITLYIRFSEKQRGDLAHQQGEGVSFCVGSELKLEKKVAKNNSCLHFL